MISFLKNLKLYKLKVRNYKLNQGMTYVELIVVLSIFALMTSIVLFDYKKFEDKVNIKVLANDIALKIVEAQKLAIAGKWNANVTLLDWKPAYGVYFDYKNNAGGGDKKFIFFTDLNQDYYYSDSNFCNYLNDVNIECLEKIDITKGNYISKIENFVNNIPTEITSSFAITFKRPDSSANFYIKNTYGIPELLITDYIKITISSSSGFSAFIRIEPSGRIQIN